MHECACRTGNAQKSITNLPLFTSDIAIPLTIPIALHELKNGTRKASPDNQKVQIIEV